jgi:hypothetical protein
MIYVESNRKLISIAVTLHVSKGTAYSIIRETNKYLPRQMPYLAIEEAADALPIPFRKPLFIAAQLVKTFQLVPNKLPQAYDEILAQTQQASNFKYYILPVRGTTYDNRQEVVAKLKYEDPVILRREPENPFDSNAIAVLTEREESIGYVAASLAKRISAQLDMLGDVPGVVTEFYKNSFPKGTLGLSIYFGLPIPTQEHATEGTDI